MYFLAPPEAQTWAVGFYALVLVFNYPHFMATIYRAYRTREDFSKYRVFTLHVTMFLVLTAVFAHSRMADLHDRLGDLVPAARAYQRALALDAAAEDARGESLDWFNYGRFLQRHGLPARLAYACFLRSEALFDSALGGQLDTVTKARAQAEAMLGDDTAEIRRDLQSVLNEALGLTDADFAFAPSP